jgi:hypothetical protein
MMALSAPLARATPQATLPRPRQTNGAALAIVGLLYGEL